jgi:hypothetical protein
VAESGPGNLCPYCSGKGDVSVPADLYPDGPRQDSSSTTWVRKPCPLCDGKGTISGDDSNVAERAAPIPLDTSSLPIFRQTADSSALFRPEKHLQALHHNEENHGPVFAKGKGVRQILSDEAIGELEKLVSELRAISYWDAEYWRQRCPERYETVAFVSRQKRRSEIIRQLSLRLLHTAKA